MSSLLFAQRWWRPLAAEAATKPTDFGRQSAREPPVSAEYTMTEVAGHCLPESCWIVLYDKVYDVTAFIYQNLHPAGGEMLLEYAGCDATTPFQDVGHSTEACRMLQNYCIGVISKDHGKSTASVNEM